SGSNATDKAKVTVYEIDLVVDSLKENTEENLGTFLGIKTRKALTIKANPVSLGGQIKITTNGLKLYNGATETTQRQWNIGSVPNLQIGGTASTTMRDKTCTLEWTGVTGLTENDLVKATVVTGNMAPASLFAVTNHETDIAYVHWNIDNDDNSTVVSGEPAKHPGGDYKQNHVAGEDNLKTLGLTLTPADLNIGTIKLTIGANAKLWKALAKGPAVNNISNLVLASGTKSWNLSNATEKADFNTLKSTLFIEGINGGGPDEFKYEYVPPIGNDIELDKVKYKFIAANCGRQPTVDVITWTGGTPIITLGEKNIIKARHSGLVDCEWSIIGAQSLKYNCVAYSVNWTDKWVNEDGNEFVIPDTSTGLPITNVTSFEAYYGVGANLKTKEELRNYFYQNTVWAFPVGTDLSNADILYYNPNSPNFHAAIRRHCQCGNPKWIMFESKDGKYEIIEHQAKQTGYGDPNILYVIGD
ncbi:MAG: hypothetical protein LBE12_13155, partial [Planctomycetaceae bacterium]|nr:hypothetical protein [Planctomycetaceae bacterium]